MFFTRPLIFPPRDDWHLRARHQTDPSTEERNHILPKAEAKGENVRALQEERTLLGEEQREPREVRPAGVDFGLGKVGVDCGRRQEVRPESLRHIEAGLQLAVRRLRRPGNPTSGCDPGPHAQAVTECEVGQTLEQPRAAHLRDLVLSRGRRPAVGLEPSLDATLHVELPLAQSRLETQCLQRNPELRTPAARQPSRLRIPDPVPIGVIGVAARFDQGVVASARGIDREDVAGTAVEEGTDDHPHVVLVVQGRVKSDIEADDTVGVRVLAEDSDDDGFRAGEHADRGAAGGLEALPRFGLKEAIHRWSRGPCRLAQISIDDQVIRKNAGPQARRLRLLGAEQDGAPERHQHQHDAGDRRARARSSPPRAEEGK